MNSAICSALLKGCQERGMLILDHLEAHLDHLDIQHSMCYGNFCFGLIPAHHNRMRCRFWPNAFQNRGFCLLGLLLCQLCRACVFWLVASVFWFCFVGLLVDEKITL